MLIVALEYRFTAPHFIKSIPDTSMNVKSYSDLEWNKILMGNKLIAVNYEAPLDNQVCRQMSEAFVMLSEKPAYADVLFLRIDSRTNPIAEEFIRKKNLPFAAIFKDGILLECNTLRSEEQLLQMIDRLIKIKISY